MGKQIALGFERGLTNFPELMGSQISGGFVDVGKGAQGILNALKGAGLNKEARKLLEGFVRTWKSFN